MAKTRAELQQYATRQYVEEDGVRLQSLTELEMSSLRTLWGQRYEKTKTTDLRMRRELLVACIVDDEGNRLFDDDEADLLAEWSHIAVDRLYNKAMSVQADPEVEEAEKNSEGIPA